MQVMIDVYFCVSSEESRLLPYESKLTTKQVTHLTLGVITGNKASKAFLVPGFFGILSGLLFGLRYAAIIRVSTYRPEPTAAPILAQANGTTVTESTEEDNSQTHSSSEPRASTEIANPNTSTPLLARPQPGSDQPSSASDNPWRACL